LNQLAQRAGKSQNGSTLTLLHKNRSRIVISLNLCEKITFRALEKLDLMAGYDITSLNELRLRLKFSEKKVYFRPK